MNVKEVRSKTILSASKIYDYVINPYVGCQHACNYCYARFIKRFSGHSEPWGEFVDIRVNAPDLLLNEIKKKKRGTVWISGLCDPYQPLEADYQLTRRCLEILTGNSWPVVIQTRSSLVTRDIDILRRTKQLEAGLTITTADDKIRKIFEPKAPPIEVRLNALSELHRAGIKTYAMIAPVLPGAELLADALRDKVDYVIVDRMNYHYADWIYRKYNMENKQTDNFFREAERRIAQDCKKAGVACNIVF